MSRSASSPPIPGPRIPRSLRSPQRHRAAEHRDKFFTSKAVDIFRLISTDVRWTVPVVKLFEIGATFVSRSEARRLLEGLETDFEVVEVDFAGVSDVGQGFVDELLRVWPNAHPGKSVVPVNMNPAVEFMVRRGLRRAAEDR